MLFTILVKIVEEKISILFMVSARGYSGKTVNNNFDLFFFGLSDNSLESFIPSQHIIGDIAAGNGKRISIRFLKLVFIHGFVKDGIVVSLQHTHEV
jgi:hypothetical protein